MVYRFEILNKIPGAGIIHHIDSDGGVWATKHREIIRFQGKKVHSVGRFPFCLPRDLFTFSRPTSRAMRSDKSNIFINHFGHILGIRGGTAYEIWGGKAEELFRIAGDCVLHGAICEDAEGNVYFGEYFMNPERKPVTIWRVSCDFKQWAPARRIEGIRHIHGIYPDPYDPGVMWVTAGDFRGENKILRSSDKFKTLETFGDGSQLWRAVRLFFTEGFICWLTDSNLEQNFACRMARSTGQLETGQQIDASSWYGCTTTEGLHIAFTTIERGPGIQTDKSHVLVSEDAFRWEPVYAFQKDFWKPVQVFKYGVISCPTGEMRMDEFYMSGEGLVGLDGISVIARIVKE